MAGRPEEALDSTSVYRSHREGLQYVSLLPPSVARWDYRARAWMDRARRLAERPAMKNNSGGLWYARDATSNLTDL